MTRCCICFILALIWFAAIPGNAIELKHQFNFNTQIYVPEGKTESIQSAALRWIPEANWSSEDSTYAIDGLVSGSFLYRSHPNLNRDPNEENAKTSVLSETHRLWVRLASDSTEVKLGLQKLTFGPSKLLRALQWFDQIQPLDPSGYTKGVKGLLVRHYFPNNSNIWLFGLSQNKDPVGPIPLESHPEAPEFGARLQLPIQQMELGLALHSRKLKKQISTTQPEEIRVGLDFFADLGTGFWLEAYQSTYKDFTFDKTYAFTLGTDYTFDIRNGLYLLGEVSQSGQSFNGGLSGIAEDSSKNNFIALQTSLSLGLLDQVIGYYQRCLTCNSIFTTFGFQRTLDAWIIDLKLYYRKNNATDIADQHSVETGTEFGLQWNI